MRPISSALAVLLLGHLAWTAPARADEPTPAQKAEAHRRSGLDPASPLESRVRPTSPAVLKMFDEPGVPVPTPHALTEPEKAKLAAAFAALPPLHRRVLSERLRSVNFLDGMPNTALTSPFNPDEPYRLYDITIRAGILDEDVSHWFTWKERTNFDAAGSTLTLDVDAGKLDAILYILLHESTHILDFCLQLTPPYDPENRPAATEFTRDIWTNRLTPAPRYRDPLLDRSRYRVQGQVLPIDQAQALYTALRRTPFASLYGSNNWHDDLAESATLYHLVEVLKQPYRIVIREKGAEVFSYEPLTSEVVRGRFERVGRLLGVKNKTP